MAPPTPNRRGRPRKSRDPVYQPRGKDAKVDTEPIEDDEEASSSDAPKQSADVDTDATANKSTTGSVSPNNDIEAPEYIVEMVTDKKVDENFVPKYLVKWENYNTSENTWEPIQNLTGCDWAIQNYQLTRANWLASRYGRQAQGGVIDIEEEPGSPQPSTSKQADKTKKTPKRVPLSKVSMRGVLARQKKEWKVDEIVGLTKVENEKYFMITLEKYELTPFIRASIANRLFPDKVIDFYMKHLKWRRKQPPKPPTPAVPIIFID